MKDLMKLKSATRLTVVLMALLVAGCSSELETGGLAEMANSNGICGEYLGYDAGHLIRNARDGLVYQSGFGQAVVKVDKCN